MKNNLPSLDQALLRRIFDGVYSGAGQSPEQGLTGDASVPALLNTLYVNAAVQLSFQAG